MRVCVCVCVCACVSRTKAGTGMEEDVKALKQGDAFASFLASQVTLSTSSLLLNGFSYIGCPAISFPGVP